MKSKHIEVISEEGNYPFSRGILARLLMATGISYIAAYNIANEIKDDLLTNSIKSIDYNELRTILYSMLECKYSTKIAENYYIWEMVRKRNIPIIVFLGGAPGVGKTTIALDLANRLNTYNTISTDTVRSVMRKVISPDLLPELHQRSYFAWETLSTPATTLFDKVIIGFEEHVRHIAIGISGVIKRAMEIKTQAIIYGVHLVPGFMSSEVISPNVIQTVLYLKGYEEHKNKFLKRFKDFKYTKNEFEQGRILHDYILKCAKREKVPIFENSDPKKTVFDIINLMTKKVQKLVS